MPPTPMTRRHAIQMLALGGLALSLGIDELRAVTMGGTHLTRVHDTRLLMGTLATLTVVTDRPNAARAAIDTSFTRMDQLEQMLSRFKPGSQVSLLNRTGALSGATPDLCRLVSKSIAYGEQTAGAFDVTVEPLLNAYRAAARQGRLPDTSDVIRLKALADYRNIQKQDDQISLQPGMGITLDGLAKGYILDAGADVLVHAGFADVLVEAGGDMMARGMTGRGGWKIGIQSPRSAMPAELLETVRVENAALTTSGDYQHQFLNTDHHHILDPQTGDSPTALCSVTVLAPNACDADALSTALMVLGPTAGLAFIAQWPCAEALMIDKQDSLWRSSGFSTLT